MKRALGAAAPIILTVYITIGNMVVFRPAIMRPLTLLAFVLMALVLYVRMKTEGLSDIEKGFLLYMALCAIAFWGLPGSVTEIIADFPTGVLYATLLAVTGLPALLGRHYFTEHYAKKRTPDAVRETDIYKTINRNMTWFWVAIFALCTFATVIPCLFALPGSLFMGLFFQVGLPGILLLGIGHPLNKKYPLYFQHRMGIDPAPSAEPGQARAAGLDIPAVTAKTKEEDMDNRPVIVALNGSPHETIGNTSQMIGMIASALAGEGFRLEEISLAGKGIGYCIGCAVCLEKGRCWQSDGHREIVDKMLAADGIILASPVYFGQVTAQMKTFIDRSLGLGHKPRTARKPGLAVSVSAGKGETDTARYLGRWLHIYGAFPVGSLTAIATNPGGFLGKELVEERAGDVARDLARAIREKRQYPATDEDLSFYLFMRDLVSREKDFMTDDYRHWQETGLLEGFLSYVQQRFSDSSFDPEVRKEWLKELMKEAKAGQHATEAPRVTPPAQPGPPSVRSCHELLEIMPLGFRSDAAGDLSATYQFEIGGPEEFIARLSISGGQCVFQDGPHPHPDVVIRAPADVWLAISRGELDGQAAFMAGKYKVEGNMALISKLKTMFGG